MHTHTKGNSNILKKNEERCKKISVGLKSDLTFNNEKLLGDQSDVQLTFLSNEGYNRNLVGVFNYYETSKNFCNVIKSSVH